MVKDMFDMIENIFGNEPEASFPTGSSLVPGVVPADRDMVCLFRSESKMMDFAKAKGLTSPSNGYDGPGKMVCARHGDTNYICTYDRELFYRFKAYSGVLCLLKEKSKEKRIELAKACLYWEPEK